MAWRGDKGLSDGLVVGRLVPAGNVGGVCGRCGGLLDTREQRVCTCSDVLCAGERRAGNGKQVTDSQISDAFAKYRYGYTHFIDRDSFFLAVKELLRGDK